MRPFDRFILVNLLLWSAVILFGYRWRHLEFYIYPLLVALVALALIGAWALVRRFDLPGWLLLLVQVGILLHLAGGSLFLGGQRLYDHTLFGGLALPGWLSQIFRYDKLVHFYWTAAAVPGLRYLLPQVGLEYRARAIDMVLIILIIMGFCAALEVCEYVGTKIATLPEVGGYDNNLQDLLANLLGALLAGAVQLAADHRRVPSALVRAAPES